MRIQGIEPDKAKELRELLERKRKTRDYASVQSWESHCYNPPTYLERMMRAANEIIGGYGVEYIPKGNNAKSPAIEYVNLGDTYDTTLLLIDGDKIRVGCWGDIVERGNYD